MTLFSATDMWNEYVNKEILLARKYSLILLNNRKYLEELLVGLFHGQVGARRHRRLRHVHRAAFEPGGGHTDQNSPGGLTHPFRYVLSFL